MKATYTEAALQALEEFRLSQQRSIEELIADRKAVLGDEELEITASDIKEAAQMIRIDRYEPRRYSFSHLVSRIYVVSGLLLMLGAFAYGPIRSLIEQNQIQAMLFFAGAGVSAVGALSGYYFSTKRREAESRRARYSSVKFPDYPYFYSSEEYRDKLRSLEKRSKNTSE